MTSFSFFQIVFPFSPFFLAFLFFFLRFFSISFFFLEDGRSRHPPTNKSFRGQRSWVVFGQSSGPLSAAEGVATRLPGAGPVQRGTSDGHGDRETHIETTVSAEDAQLTSKGDRSRGVMALEEIEIDAKSTQARRDNSAPTLPTCPNQLCFGRTDAHLQRCFPCSVIS